MNGQEHPHALPTTNLSGASNSKSNGTPSGAVNSNSWLKDIMADRMQAVQVGLMSARPDNPNQLPSHFDGSVLPQNFPFPAMSYNPLLYMSQLQHLGEQAQIATSNSTTLNQQHLLMPTIGDGALASKPFSPRFHSSNSKDPGSLKHGSTSSAEHPIKRSKTEEIPSTAANSAPSTNAAHSSAAESSIPYRPDYFRKGSIIQLGDNKLKRIEDLETSDFESSAHLSANLSLDCSTVTNIVQKPHRGTASLTFSVGNVGDKSHEQVQATVEATLEHPFFVYGQGWSSISPEKTLSYYQLNCQQLKVQDRCISLTFKENSSSSTLNATSSVPQK